MPTPALVAAVSNSGHPIKPARSYVAVQLGHKDRKDERLLAPRTSSS